MWLQCHRLVNLTNVTRAVGQPVKYSVCTFNPCSRNGSMVRFSTSSFLQLPRRPSTKNHQEDCEIEDIRSEPMSGPDVWKEFIKTRSGDQVLEKRIPQAFGDIRFDGDNIPAIHGQFDPNFEVDPIDSSLAKDAQQPGQNRPGSRGSAIGAAFEEMPVKTSGSDNSVQTENSWYFDRSPPSPSDSGGGQQFTAKFREFVPQQSGDKVSKRYSNERLQSNTQVLDMNGSSTKKESKKADKISTSSAKEEKPLKHAVSDDLNYVDKITFGVSFDRFSEEEASKPRKVTVGESSVTDLRSEQLNTIDSQYFNAGFESNPLSQIVSPDASSIVYKSPSNLSENAGTPNNAQPLKMSDDEASSLNYFDQQLFSSTQEKASPVKSSEQEPVSLSHVKDVKHESKDKKRSLEKVEESQFDGDEEELIIKSKPLRKPLHEKKRSKSSTSAMDYVKKLRKANDTMTNVNPSRDASVDMIGVGIAKRLEDATGNYSLTPRISKKEDEADLELTDAKSYKHVKDYSPPDIQSYNSFEVKKLLLSKVLYNDHGVMALWKPYGLPMFSSENSKTSHCLEKYLPYLAAELNCDQLFEVHRLDKTTTGVVLLAKSEETRRHLKSLFAERQIEKQYLAITNGVPKSVEGIINIPVSEGRIGDRFRMTLRPDYKSSKIITNKSNFKGAVSGAATEYRVQASRGSAALVQCIMLSGVKHQIRLHLGLGLGCPILGDSKYSWADRLGPPQHVKGDILQRLKLKKSQARHLPIFLHSQRVSIPNFLPPESGNVRKNLTIIASNPHFFSRVMQKLKISSFN